MELDRTAIRDEAEAASEAEEGPVPQAPTLHGQAAVEVGVLPPEARPLDHSVAAVEGLTRVREEAVAEEVVVHHPVEAGVAAVAVDINRSNPRVL